ncbi:uncharacterized protein LOC126691020 [Quercus robur]|uniref:uncharacterized protein LOC126691020 n=1 Tax=Quercus robur TaxID=38942 RepID=UPI002163D3F7|nr:uncharacterized protein LOC126691020 [Quercus robur]
METRVGGERAKELIDRLPFDGEIHTDSMGYAGGLWVLWNSDRVEVSSLANIEQEIHIMVKVRFSNASWLFSTVYASPRNVERQVLWNNLMEVAGLHNLPWVIAGDFNEPLLDDDKFGGRAVSVNRSLLFKECPDKCSMLDIGFSGPRFTWTNKREVQALIQERINRFFVNPSWCLLYPEARVTHLTRSHSDHCPVLLEMLPRVNGAKKRPFRFQTCWLLDATFPSIVSQAWEGGNGLADALDLFSRKAAVWNKFHFGSIFTRKKNLMARINGIQRVVANNPSNFLLNLEKDLLKELDLVLNQEEELWALKSRVNWMIQGDRNTAFYHVSTLVRRKRNQILAIKNPWGIGFMRRMRLRMSLQVVLKGFFQRLCFRLLELILLFLNGNSDSQRRKRRLLVGVQLKKRLKVPCGL